MRNLADRCGIFFMGGLFEAIYQTNLLLGLVLNLTLNPFCIYEMRILKDKELKEKDNEISKLKK